MVQIITLEKTHFLLAKRFYQQHYPKGRPKKSDQLLCAKARSGIIGAVRLQLQPDHTFLTGLLVHPDHRQQQLAQRLLHAAITQVHTWPLIWFAQRDLAPVYATWSNARLGDQALPLYCQQKLKSYRHHQPELEAYCISSAPFDQN